MKKPLFIAFWSCLVLCLPTMPLQAKRAEPTKVPLKKSIAVSTPTSKQLVVTVRFTNVSDFDVFVLKDPPSLFVTLDGEELADIGPTDKRKPPTLADYERLLPGRSTERRKEIASQFAWKPGAHTYEVEIAGGYTDPQSGRSWRASRIVAKFIWTE